MRKVKSGCIDVDDLLVALKKCPRDAVIDTDIRGNYAYLDVYYDDENDIVCLKGVDA